MKKSVARASFHLSILVAVTSIFWLRETQGWEPLVASISSILGIVVVASFGRDSGRLQRSDAPKISTFLHGEKRDRDRYIGEWSGFGRDANLPKKRDACNHYPEARLRLDSCGSTIRGEFSLVLVNEKEHFHKHLQCDVELIAACSDFIMLRFAMTDVRANHFGVLFLQISDAGSTLRGYFLKKRAFGAARFGLAVFEFRKQTADLAPPDPRPSQDSPRPEFERAVN